MYFSYIDQARSDTPGCSEVLHLNNAGAALPVQKTIDTIVSHLNMEARTGSYEAARIKSERLSSVYDSIAALINARADEIAIVESATRAWDMAFYSIKFEYGDRILVSDSEYASNIIAYSQTEKRHGIAVEVIPGETEGQLSVSALKDMIDDRTKLIAVTHIPSNNGLVQPVALIGEIANKAGICYLLDACQSVGQLPVDVKEIGCDFLSAAGRKYLRGPRGTGFLYARKNIIERSEPPFLDLHAARMVGNIYRIRPDAKRFENWEFNVAARLGLGTAVEYALNIDIKEAYSYIQSLARHLRGLLLKIGGVQVHDRGPDPCGIVTFTMENVLPIKIRDGLMRKGINVSVAEPASRYREEPGDKNPAVVRASAHYYNTPEEMDRFAEELGRQNIVGW